MERACGWMGSMVYCFIWLSQQTGALQEAIGLSKPTIIVSIRANENVMTQWLISVNKRGAVSCRIGEGPRWSSSQPTCFSVIEKCCKTTFEWNKDNRQTQNMVKKMYRWKSMPMYTDEWIKFNWRYLGWLKYV